MISNQDRELKIKNSKLKIDPLIRLSKLAAQRGLCSRREADRFIERGWLLVDGEPVTTLGTRVEEHRRITLAPEARRAQQQLATVLLNKPVDYVSGQPEKGYRAAVTLIRPENRWRKGDKPPSRDGLAPAG
ncbi:MAG: S4 domain-containing protein, partial [Pseudomonadota bacterium]|nr:S4 domain-containing protein [Pseudomonadota bacterium]